jgi:di/tricarboxylate transporter
VRRGGVGWWLAWAGAIVAPCAVVLVLPTPQGLPREGQRVLAVAALAVGLWGTEALPAGVTGVVVVIALVLLRAVPGMREALVGFADPVAYFLIGVLTIGLAVSHSGLAERVARASLRGSRGRPRALYLQLLAAFPLLTLLLPSATTRTGILVHVYDQALALSGVAPGAPIARAVMMALNSINRLASTVLLTGGITPIVAAGLIGGISWTRWFTLMSVPYGVLLLAGALRDLRALPPRLRGRPPGRRRRRAGPLSAAGGERRSSPRAPPSSG